MLGRFLRQTGVDTQGGLGVLAGQWRADDGQLRSPARSHFALRSRAGSDLRPESCRFRAGHGSAFGAVVYGSSREPYPAVARPVLVAASPLERRAGRTTQARLEDETRSRVSWEPAMSTCGIFDRQCKHMFTAQWRIWSISPGFA